MRNGSLYILKKNGPKMRKITLNPRIGNKSSFDFANDWIVVKDGDTVLEFQAPIRQDDYLKFTPEQMETIRTVNYVLEHNGRVAMTQEEADYLIFPFGRETKIKPEDLQALAGFKVEKTIVKIGE